MNGFDAYRAGGHHAVHGWMQAGLLDFLTAIDQHQKEMGVDGGVAEIGVHHGRLFIALHLLLGDGERSAAFDIFDSQELNIDQSGFGDRGIFEQNLRLHAPKTAERALIVPGDSMGLTGADVLERLGTRVRLFSVDGGHWADIVCHDLHTAADSLSPGGVIIADDVFNQSWPDVCVGFLRFLSERPEFAPFAVGYNKVLVARAEDAPAFLELIVARSAELGDRSKDQELDGHPVHVIGMPKPRPVPSNASKPAPRRRWLGLKAT